MQQIPGELLTLIFKLLGKQDLSQCQLVCSRWGHFSSKQLWFNPNLMRMSQALSLFTTMQSSNTSYVYTDFIRKLDLAPIARNIHDGLLTKLECIKRTEYLSLANCSQLTFTGVWTFLDSSRIGPELIALDLSNVPCINDNVIRKIMEHCPKLQELNLSMARPRSNITDSSIIELAQKYRDLTKIKLCNCVKITEKASIALAYYCRNLTEVDLAKCGVTNRALYGFFKYSKNLRELRLSQCEPFDCLLNETMVINPPLENSCLEQLRSVDFSHVSALTDHSISTLVQVAPYIQSLTLTNCFKVTDEGALSIARLGNFLQHLHMGHCNQLTDLSIMEIARECTNLHYLDLTSCAEITNRPIIELAKNAPMLRRIGLSKCLKITDTATDALALYSQYLERAHFSYCFQLTARGILTLLRRCKLLNHLSLTCVPDFIREDYLVHSKEPPHGVVGHQRDVFCVYSGACVNHIKEYLEIFYNGSTVN